MNTHQLVYSKNVIEFVTVASEYCGSIEKGVKQTAHENLQKLHRILPLLYLKATLLPTAEPLLDDELEKYVTELDYNLLNQKWLEMLGENDSFYEVFDPEIQFGNEKVTASISENLMDIYQDLKNFLMAYSIGNEEIMNDALHECTSHFAAFWGQQLVNVLRAVHQLVYGGIDLDEQDTNATIQPGKGNPKWLDNFWGTQEENQDNEHRENF